MVIASGITLALLAAVAGTAAVPVLEARQSTSTLSVDQVASYKPYTYYAGAAYCSPASTLAWSCGTNCNQNSGFKPIASGGDGAVIQYWYVGYDATLQTIIAGYQGTDGDKILPLLTDIDLSLTSLDADLFPGIGPSVKTHKGFGNAHARSAGPVLAAVKNGLSTYNTTTVTVVGHSLGAALAIISTLHLSLNLPSTTVLKTIAFSAPRVGNAGFVDFVNPRADMVRINNKKDFVPILPGRSLGYAHTEGEIHISTSSPNPWISCPGQDNTNSQCTIGTVPNVFEGNVNDHSGPFNGVKIGC